MSDLTRFSVSLEADLLEAFDKFVRDGSFATRSEAIRQLLRQHADPRRVRRRRSGRDRER